MKTNSLPNICGIHPESNIQPVIVYRAKPHGVIYYNCLHVVYNMIRKTEWICNTHSILKWQITNEWWNQEVTKEFMGNTDH